jgi:uncharacterized membrane protein (DUF2068 family)|tara:strand:+ start:9598 stop:9771 length:174 start_codon:yes stop_codon:yes gene_type:complete
MAVRALVYFLAGFAYVVDGVGLWMQQRWGIWLAASITIVAALTFTAFGAHVYSGGAY